MLFSAIDDSQIDRSHSMVQTRPQKHNKKQFSISKDNYSNIEEMDVLSRDSDK